MKTLLFIIVSKIITGSLMADNKEDIKWNDFQKMQDKNEHNCIMYKLPKEISKKVLDWGKAYVPDEEIYDEEYFGREDYIHTTVHYGTCNLTKNMVRELQKIKPFVVKLGKTDIFNTSPDYDVLFISVDSPELEKLHNSIKEKYEEFESEHTNYKPHVTIAYLKKGFGQSYIDRKDFVGIEMEADNIIYSDKRNRKFKIKFNIKTEGATSMEDIKKGIPETKKIDEQIEMFNKLIKYVEDLPVMEKEDEDEEEDNKAVSNVILQSKEYQTMLACLKAYDKDLYYRVEALNLKKSLLPILLSTMVYFIAPDYAKGESKHSPLMKQGVELAQKEDFNTVINKTIKSIEELNGMYEDSLNKAKEYSEKYVKSVKPDNVEETRNNLRYVIYFSNDAVKILSLGQKAIIMLKDYLDHAKPTDSISKTAVNKGNVILKGIKDIFENPKYNQINKNIVDNLREGHRKLGQIGISVQK